MERHIFFFFASVEVESGLGVVGDVGGLVVDELLAVDLDQVALRHQKPLILVLLPILPRFYNQLLLLLLLLLHASKMLRTTRSLLIRISSPRGRLTTSTFLERVMVHRYRRLYHFVFCIWEELRGAVGSLGGLLLH